MGVDETYPAAVAEQATLMEVRAVLKGTMAAKDGKSKGSARDFLCCDADSNYWLRMQPHPYLARALPGVVFYVTPEVSLYPGAFDMPWARIPIASRAGRLYRLPYQVTHLLRDCGMKFEPSDIPVWSRVLTVIYTMFHVRGRNSLHASFMGLDSEFQPGMCSYRS